MTEALTILHLTIVAIWGKKGTMAKKQKQPKPLAPMNEKLLKTYNGQKDCITSLSFSPDGNRILASSWDNTPHIWDVSTGHIVVTLKGHLSSVYDAAFTPDGAKVLTGSADNTVRL